MTVKSERRRDNQQWMLDHMVKTTGRVQNFAYDARIVPPTSQNQASIEEDLANFVGGFLDLPEEELQRRCEQTVRNYDPCISCATHFLRLDVDRS